MVDRKTEEYYSFHAEEYFRETVNAYVSEALEKFLSYIPKSGRILDCGCGSGRDTKYFLSLGYAVDAIDASREMCVLASRYTKQGVVCMDYNAIDKVDVYDGIWASSSLLHERRENLFSLFVVLSRSLKRGGVFYCSFREGSIDAREGERWYTNMSEEGLNSILPPSLSVLEIWYSMDARPGYSYRWMNIILEKS